MSREFATLDDRLPRDTTAVFVEESSTVQPGHEQSTHLDVSWQLHPDDLGRIKECRILAAMKSVGGRGLYGPFRELARARGSATRALVPIPSQKAGTTWHVVVQPISLSGLSGRPDRLLGQVITLLARLAPPPAPMNFQASMEADRVVYTWDAPADAEGLTYEIRSGGWALGQPVGVTEATRLTTGWWAGAEDDSEGNGPVLLHLKARTPQGMYGDSATLLFDPQAEGSVLLADGELVTGAVMGRAWHEEYDGWVQDSAPPAGSAILTDLERVGSGFYPGALHFAGSALTGTYVTDIPLNARPAFFERSERIYVEAVWEAYQEAPDVLTDIETPVRRDLLGHPNAINYSVEGDLQAVEQCSLALEINVVVPFEGGPGYVLKGWEKYVPGAYFGVGAQFRITATRPSTDWDIRIRRFHTRFSRIAPARHYRTPVQEQMALEVLYGS